MEVRTRMVFGWPIEFEWLLEVGRTTEVGNPMGKVKPREVRRSIKIGSR